MSAEWDVQSALVTSFDALDLGPTSFENREFTPPNDGSLWYELFTLPGGRDPFTMGDEGDDEYTGVFQIDVNGPVGEGTRTIVDAAGFLTAFYKAGKVVSSNGRDVKIHRSEISQARPGAASVVISVTVYWRTMIPRAG